MDIGRDFMAVCGNRHPLKGGVNMDTQTRRNSRWAGWRGRPPCTVEERSKTSRMTALEFEFGKDFKKRKSGLKGGVRGHGVLTCGARKPERAGTLECLKEGAQRIGLFVGGRVGGELGRGINSLTVQSPVVWVAENG